MDVVRHGTTASERPELHDLIFERDEVYWQGARVSPRQPSTYVALNKPSGVLSSVAPQGPDRTLREWLDQLQEGTFPIGRLDQATSGLVLLTDDGDLAHMLMLPDVRIVQRYVLTLQGPPGRIQGRVHRMSDGVEVRPKETASVLKITCREEHDDATVVCVDVDEGRSKLLRAMCHALHLRLTGLHREAIGPLALGRLESGQMRALSREEVDELWGSCGGRDLVDQRRVEALERLAARHHDEGGSHERLDAWLDDYRAHRR